MRRLLTAVLVLYPVVVFGQTSQPVAPTSVEVLVIAPNGNPATDSSVASRATPIAQASPNCNIATVPAPGPSPLVNPTAYYVEDPFNSTAQVKKYCKGDMPTGVPNANGYQSTAIFIAPSCTINNSTVTPCPSARSTAGSPLFNIQPVQAPPAAPTPPAVRP